MRSCDFKDCGRPHEAKGLCGRHYKAERRKVEPATVGHERKAYLKAHGRSLAGRYTALRRAAKVKGLGFGITEEEHATLLTQPCTYCGGPLNPTGHSLDRVFNDRGYTIDNVLPCCITCNRIRGDNLTVEEMRVAMRAVKKFRKGGSCGA